VTEAQPSRGREESGGSPGLVILAQHSFHFFLCPIKAWLTLMKKLNKSALHTYTHTHKTYMWVPSYKSRQSQLNASRHSVSAPTLEGSASSSGPSAIVITWFILKYPLVCSPPTARDRLQTSQDPFHWGFPVLQCNAPGHALHQQAEPRGLMCWIPDNRYPVRTLKE
jgi:hypothetical protein